MVHDNVIISVGGTGEDGKPSSYLVCVKERCVVGKLWFLCAHVLSDALKLGMKTKKGCREDMLQVMCQPKADLKVMREVICDPEAPLPTTHQASERTRLMRAVWFQIPAGLLPISCCACQLLVDVR
eukprot:14573246-Ditylum_brightwellii.AAC.1